MSGETLTLLEASRRALAAEMRRDKTVWVLGEDVGRGGVYQQYRGLQAEFGPARVLDTPISEAAIVGAAVGAALVGTRPVVEMRYLDFALCAADEIVNQAAKARYMFGGQARVPMVIRMPIGIWQNTAAQHSQSLEAWWAHIPGLVVLCPATPADSAAMMTAAIRADDPVILLEHKDLWPLAGPVPAGEGEAAIGRARIMRPGADVTIVSWAALAHEAARAADLLVESGVTADVIDLRSIWPWDRDAVCDSAARTGRLLVVHEAVLAAGFGAEVAATVAEHCPGVRVKRLGAPRLPVPFSPPLEDATYRITAAAIAAAARALVA
jgi:pyruvate dehydrogenase E1 component beta subunit